MKKPKSSLRPPPKPKPKPVKPAERPKQPTPQPPPAAKIVGTPAVWPEAEVVQPQEHKKGYQSP